MQGDFPKKDLPGTMETKCSAEGNAEVTTLSTPEVPNGGATAWLQVISSFFIFFNTW